MMFTNVVVNNVRRGSVLTTKHDNEANVRLRQQYDDDVFMATNMCP